MITNDAHPPRRRWLQFELRGLLIGVTFVAIGIAMLSTLSPSDPNFSQLSRWRWFIGPVFVGAGLFFPFRHPVIGGILGFISQLIVSAVLIEIALRNSEL